MNKNTNNLLIAIAAIIFALALVVLVVRISVWLASIMVILIIGAIIYYAMKYYLRKP